MKTELVVPAHSMDHVDALLKAGADAIILGEQAFALRLPGEFTFEQITEATKTIKAAGKKVYVSVNALFHNESIDALKTYMEKLSTIGIDRLIFGDPAVVQLNRELGNPFTLIWNTEMTATNWFTANYWGERGSDRAFLARELSLDEVLEIKENAKLEIEVQVHGMTCMFQSKRKLLGNYYLYLDKAMKVEPNQSGMMNLYDKERDNHYPILEDANGTHIFSPNDICIIDELTELLEANIDAFRIDGILHEENYVTEITALYREALDAYAQSPDKYEDLKDQLAEKVAEIQPSYRKIDTGFLFKETVY